MPKFEYDSLTAFLRERFDDDLRWVANFDCESYDYEFHHVRADLRTELTDQQLDYLIHRALAAFSKRDAEEVYFHLGDAEYLLADYERGTALHLFLDDRRGVTIVLEPDATIQLPDFVAECRDRLEPA